MEGACTVCTYLLNAEYILKQICCKTRTQQRFLWKCARCIVRSCCCKFYRKRVEKAYTKHRVQIWFNSKTHGGCIALAHCTDSTEFFFSSLKHLNVEAACIAHCADSHANFTVKHVERACCPYPKHTVQILQ